MNPSGKKFISFFLIFSLMMLSVNLYAKERRGAKLLITKKDGQQVEGELITVKPNSLLLLDTEGKDVSIDIGDIKVITIENGKSRFWPESGYGFLIAGGIGALVGVWQGSGSIGFTGGDISSEEKALRWGIFLGLVGGIIGGIFGVIDAKKYKEIHIEGMSQNETKRILKKLRKKARIRDYK